MRVISAANRSLRVTAGSRVANDSDASAGQTNEHVEVLEDNSKEAKDSSRSGVGGADNLVTADITRGGGGRAVVALLDRDRDTADGDEVVVAVVLACNLSGITTAKENV